MACPPILGARSRDPDSTPKARLPFYIRWLKMKAFLFDLDGTLFDRDAAVRELVEAQYAAFAPRLRVNVGIDFVARVLELDAHGHGNKVEVYATIVGERGLPEGLASELTADFWRRYRQGPCRPFPDAVSTLTELRRRGLKTGVISNGVQSIQDAKIDALALRSLLDTISISETEGVRKPDRRIFERTVERLGIAPAECTFVGDHPEADIAGARAAGLHAIWRSTPHWAPPPDPVPTIDTLSEILRYM
jgi:putative hydrolase of the HAD superfamily